MTVPDWSQVWDTQPAKSGKTDVNVLNGDVLEIVWTLPIAGRRQYLEICGTALGHLTIRIVDPMQQ